MTDFILAATNLCTIWIGRHHLHANAVHFERSAKPVVSSPKETFKGSSKNSFASILKGGPLPSVKEPVPSEPAIVLDASCLKEYDFELSLMGQVKDIAFVPNLYSALSNEGFHNLTLSYLGGTWILIELNDSKSKELFLNHTGVGSWFVLLMQASNSFVCDERIIWVEIDGLPIKALTPMTFNRIASLWGEIVDMGESDNQSLSSRRICLKTKKVDIINEKRKVIIHGNIFWIRAKELKAWVPSFFVDDDFSSDDEDLPEHDVPENVDVKENIDTSDVKKVSESSFSQVNDLVFENSPILNDGNSASKSADPFNIYGLLNEHNKPAINPIISGPEYPPGFTPADDKGDGTESVNGVNDQTHTLSPKFKERNLKEKVSSEISMKGGSILEVMDELVKVGQTMGYNMDGCVKNIEAIIGSQGDFEAFR
ncbi:hypothetical protein Tco_0866121 [Tanacetum coccineum]